MIRFSYVRVVPPRLTKESGRLEKLSRVIGLIYDAALKPELWPGTLREVASFVGATVVMLIVEEAAGSRFVVLSDEMRVPSGAGSRHPTGPATIETREVVSDRSDGLTCVLTAVRSGSRGPDDATTRARLSLLSPHVGRAIEIGRRLDARPIEIDHPTDLIDVFASGVFLLGADGRVVWRNAAGAALAAHVGDLRIVKGWLGGDHLGLEPALRRATQADPHALLEIRADDGTRMVGHLLALKTRPARQATHALLVRAVVPLRPSYGAALQQRHGLTNREMSVVAALVETGGVPEIAALLGLSVSTVKSYLKSVFSKTGVRRQADLVALVAGTVRP